MNIAVVGTGYVGLVTGAVFADLGNDVVCVDKDGAKIGMLHAGQMPIYEPGLEELVQRNVADGRLGFTTDLSQAVRRSDIIFIAVGTPPKASGESDLSAVEEVALGIARSLDRYKVIVNKSTVPVGTGDVVRDIIARNRRRPVEFDVVSNPEFLREGSAIEDTLRPDRIVIGAPNQQVAMTLLELYAPLERPMIITDVPSAEMIKYASNSFLATKISFINAIANICELAGADVTQVVKGMGLDPRIGSAFLQPGLGYGGSCFPKDTDSLIQNASALGYEFRLLRSVVDINRDRAQRFVALIRKVLAPLDDRVIAVLGLAFKPKTDDMRDARSIEVVKHLLEGGARVRAYDPVAMANAKTLLPPGVEYCQSSYEAAEGADAAAIVTEWNEFKLLNLERLRGVMRRPLIFDGRNIYEPERMRRLGFEYHSIGRRAVYPT
ncbi:MAG TPA: UDP-glucose/GDP-mannose dehydrogenase family protein [Methylomirabilota bacterium]|jgi:UDPglucose 6-dehydrogenase|nr:UDP-glucose/GDP-mannose dehydrogenase family protein [Methylomirabilota bacterium]